MKDPAIDPAVWRRMAMARYAHCHNEAQAARHFGCCWATIQVAVQRVEEYERTGDIRVLQNRPRGHSNRTSVEVEDRVIEKCVLNYVTKAWIGVSWIYRARVHRDHIPIGSVLRVTKFIRTKEK